MVDNLTGDYETMLRSDYCPQPKKPGWCGAVVARFNYYSQDDIRLKIRDSDHLGRWVQSDSYTRLDQME